MAILSLLLSASIVSASFSGNLNYRSPSLNHPDLGISIRKVVKRNNPTSPFDPADLKFTHGVASGDPYPDSAILWTRVAPANADNSNSNVTVSGTASLYDHDNAAYVAISTAPICVVYKMAEDKGMQRVVDKGTVWTSSDVDYTVKVEANGLMPYTTYYYQFHVCDSDNKSPVGRTKTTPRKKDKLHKSVKIAVYSCSNYQFGFFNAYGNVARKDSVDYVIHLGDYIYEHPNGEHGWGNAINRIPQPEKAVVTLYDYRKRYATYRTDLDLLESHKQFPWIPVWDDHEVADNTWKSGSAEMNNTEDTFIKDGGISVDQRKAHAVRAYFEWMPIRQVDMDDNLRIWRTFPIGDLFDLIMLDTRSYDRDITDLYWNTDYVHAISNEPSRSLMGARQETWFYRQLVRSSKRGARWRVIGNQIVFSNMNVSLATGTQNPNNYDSWDGYVANRNRTFNTLLTHNISNTIFLAGDSHASWVSDLVYNFNTYDSSSGAGSIGVEFAGTAVTSPSPIGQNVTKSVASMGSNWLIGANPELQWQDLYYRGYYTLEIGYEKVKAEYFGTPDILSRNGKEIKLAEFVVKQGENRICREEKRVAYAGAIRGGEVKNGTVIDTGSA